MERHEDEGAKAFDSRLARRLLGYLRPYRMRAAISVVLVILSSLFQLAGPVITAVAIDLFVVPAAGGETVGVSRTIAAWMAGRGIELDPLSGINVAAALYFLSLLGGFAVLYSQMVLMNIMGQYIMYDLRKQIFGHLQKLDIQFFDRNPVGRLITRVTTDVDALNELFTAGFVAIFGDIFVLAGIVGVLFWMNWRLALVLFSILPFIVLISIWFRRGARITYRQVRARIAAINAFLQEHLSGMSTVQLFNREESEAAKFDGLNARHRDANIDSIFYYAVFYPMIELIETVGLALIVWYGGAKVMEGTLSLGALVAFFQYSQRFYQPISDLSEKYNILQAAMAASERIFKLLDTKAKIRDEGTLEAKTFESLELRNVWFAYDEGLRDEGLRAEGRGLSGAEGTSIENRPTIVDEVLESAAYVESTRSDTTQMRDEGLRAEGRGLSGAEGTSIENRPTIVDEVLESAAYVESTRSDTTQPSALSPQPFSTSPQPFSTPRPSSEWVLRDVSFRVNRGERIALVGHTGAGKTTVTSLLLRFYDIQRGEILINGVDIRKYSLESLRRLFAIVQQDLFLFTGSIRDNIALGDAAISKEQILTAASRVQADRFISRLPETYDAHVRERGAGLSVGEKQLLSFARALAFDPPVLILDEATSSIDTETEQLIQEAIQTLLRGRTSIVIAHRLSTIRSADTILVFHHGEIREQGTHEELMQLGGLYRRLYEIQYRETVAAAV